DPEMTLLTYLRRKLGLTGTKLGCAEGGCGACTVMLSRYQTHTQQLLYPQSSLRRERLSRPLCSLHLVAVTTVEGIGSVARELHPVQERIAMAHGSQCGFCTPGIVMSMYALLRNNPKPKMADVEEAFHGNLCRCTGYRPILEGYKTILNAFDCKLCFCFLQEATSLFNPADFTPFDPTQEVIFPPELMSLSKDQRSGLLCFRGDRASWLQPDSLDEFLRLKWEHPDARVVVGNTEVGIEVKFKNMVYPVILAPAFIPELNNVSHTADGEYYLI
uniref:FAD-binding PCMH-type domain-containing protein n=1 Tax=Labrus bergylta TaxID=56723 RepID=A0A3Q3H2Y7_9LABR